MKFFNKKRVSLFLVLLSLGMVSNQAVSGFDGLRLEDLLGVSNSNNNNNTNNLNNNNAPGGLFNNSNSNVNNIAGGNTNSSNFSYSDSKSTDADSDSEDGAFDRFMKALNGGDSSTQQKPPSVQTQQKEATVNLKNASEKLNATSEKLNATSEKLNRASRNINSSKTRDNDIDDDEDVNTTSKLKSADRKLKNDKTKGTFVNLSEDEYSDLVDSLADNMVESLISKFEDVDDDKKLPKAIETLSKDVGNVKISLKKLYDRVGKLNSKTAVPELLKMLDSKEFKNLDDEFVKNIKNYVEELKSSKSRSAQKRAVSRVKDFVESVFDQVNQKVIDKFFEDGKLNDDYKDSSKAIKKSLEKFNKLNDETIDSFKVEAPKSNKPADKKGKPGAADNKTDKKGKPGAKKTAKQTAVDKKKEEARKKALENEEAKKKLLEDARKKAEEARKKALEDAGKKAEEIKSGGQPGGGQPGSGQPDGKLLEDKYGLNDVKIAVTLENLENRPYGDVIKELDTVDLSVVMEKARSKNQNRIADIINFLRSKNYNKVADALEKQIPNIAQGDIEKYKQELTKFLDTVEMFSEYKKSKNSAEVNQVDDNILKLTNVEKLQFNFLVKILARQFTHLTEDKIKQIVGLSMDDNFKVLRDELLSILKDTSVDSSGMLNLMLKYLNDGDEVNAMQPGFLKTVEDALFDTSNIVLSNKMSHLFTTFQDIMAKSSLISRVGSNIVLEKNVQLYNLYNKINELAGMYGRLVYGVAYNQNMSMDNILESSQDQLSGQLLNYLFSKVFPFKHYFYKINEMGYAVSSLSSKTTGSFKYLEFKNGKDETAGANTLQLIPKMLKFMLNTVGSILKQITGNIANNANMVSKFLQTPVVRNYLRLANQQAYVLDRFLKFMSTPAINMTDEVINKYLENVSDTSVKDKVKEFLQLVRYNAEKTINNSYVQTYNAAVIDPSALINSGRRQVNVLDTIKWLGMYSMYLIREVFTMPYSGSPTPASVGADQGMTVANPLSAMQFGVRLHFKGDSGVAQPTYGPRNFTRKDLEETLAGGVGMSKTRQMRSLANQDLGNGDTQYITFDFDFAAGGRSPKTILSTDRYNLLSSFVSGRLWNAYTAFQDLSIKTNPYARSSFLDSANNLFGFETNQLSSTDAQGNARIFAPNNDWLLAGTVSSALAGGRLNYANNLLSVRYNHATAAFNAILSPANLGVAGVAEFFNGSTSTPDSDPLILKSYLGATDRSFVKVFDSLFWDGSDGISKTSDYYEAFVGKFGSDTENQVADGKIMRLRQFFDMASQPLAVDVTLDSHGVVANGLDQIKNFSLKSTANLHFYNSFDLLRGFLSGLRSALFNDLENVNNTVLRNQESSFMYQDINYMYDNKVAYVSKTDPNKVSDVTDRPMMDLFLSDELAFLSQDMAKQVYENSNSLNDGLPQQNFDFDKMLDNPMIVQKLQRKLGLII